MALSIVHSEFLLLDVSFSTLLLLYIISISYVLKGWVRTISLNNLIILLMTVFYGD